MKNRAEHRKYHIIYKTTCLETGRWYIGMHSTDDVNDGYLGSGTFLSRSIKKHGKEAHRYEVLEYLPSRVEVSLREEEILTKELRSDPQCMNLRGGGTGNDPGFWEKKNEDRLKETKAIISENSKQMWARRKADPEKLAEHIAKINTEKNIAKRAEAIKSKGHKRSEEQLKNLSAGQAKYRASVDPKVLIERHARGGMSNAKIWIVEDQLGAMQEVTNLQKFSKEHGISGTALYKTETSGNYRNGYRIIRQLAVDSHRRS